MGTNRAKMIAKCCNTFVLVRAVFASRAQFLRVRVQVTGGVRSAVACEHSEYVGNATGSGHKLLEICTSKRL